MEGWGWCWGWGWGRCVEGEQRELITLRSRCLLSAQDHVTFWHLWETTSTWGRVKCQSLSFLHTCTRLVPARFLLLSCLSSCGVLWCVQYCFALCIPPGYSRVQRLETTHVLRFCIKELLFCQCLLSSAVKPNKIKTKSDKGLLKRSALSRHPF